MTTKKHLIIAAVAGLAILTPSESYPKPIVIAVIDTGINAYIPNLCKMGHKSFVKSKPLVDVGGHGTLMAKLINENIGVDGEYCIVSIKWYDPKATDSEHIVAMRQAIQYAINIKVAYINVSGGGGGPTDEERKIIKQALDNKVTIVASAGNEGYDIGKDCNFFPACYDDRIITVGNLKDTKSREPSSNYGNYVKHWEIGVDVTGAFMPGTSQAAAITTGKLVKRRLGRIE